MNSLPEVKAALDYWAKINETANAWASFEAVSFPNDLVIRVKVGYTYHKFTENACKEAAIKTRIFYQTDDGKVDYYDIVHA